MNINETTNALALAQAYDNRTVGEVNIRAWHAILGDLEVGDVLEAIRRHYAVETTWIMPAHIRLSVGAIVGEREKVARATGWAPGQAGVPKDQAHPEVMDTVKALDQLPASVLDLVTRVRAMLPEGSREALRPRTVAWERHQRDFARTDKAEPNPYYRPGGRGFAADEVLVDEVADFQECGEPLPDGPCRLRAGHPVGTFWPGFNGHMA